MKPADLGQELFAALATPFSGEALFDCLSDVAFFIKNSSQLAQLDGQVRSTHRPPDCRKYRAPCSYPRRRAGSIPAIERFPMRFPEGRSPSICPTWRNNN